MSQSHVKPEYYAYNKYPAWKRRLNEPAVKNRFVTIKIWQLIPSAPWLIILWLWYTITESTLFTIPPLWMIVWGPALIILFFVVDTQRFHRFVTYLGWFYLLRGRDQAPIMELKMGRTARYAVRTFNAFEVGSLLWLLDYTVFWINGTIPPGFVLLVKFLIYWAFFFLVFFGIDQWWVFRRTRFSLVVLFFVSLATIGLFWLWFTATADITICPPIWCPPA